MHTRCDRAVRGGPQGRFDGQTKLLLVVNGLFITANALSGTFLGVYLWKASQSYLALGWFTLLTHIVMVATFWIAGNGVKEGNKMLWLRIGIGFSAVFYGTVLLLGKSAIDCLWLLGLLNGISIGLFWLAYNVIYFEVTDADNRDRYNGLAGVMGSIVGIAVPWFSGFVLSQSAGDRGYRYIFMASLVIFVAGILVSFLLRDRRTSGDYEWSMPIRTLTKRGPWRAVFGALAAQGLRESVFGVMIGLLVYLQSGSELALGNFVLINSVVGFASFYAAGKWLKPSWRYIGMGIGTIVITAIVAIFFAGVSRTTLIVFGVVVSLFFPLYLIPMTSTVFDLIGQDDDSVSRRVEYVVLRELGLNAGRIAGMLVFMMTLGISHSPLVINWLLLIVGSAPIFGWRLMRERLKRAGASS